MSQKYILSANDPNRLAVLENLIAYLRGLPEDKTYVNETKEKQKQRTDPQNRTLFGVKYPPLMEFMGLSGDREKNELHEFFCGEFFGWIEYEIMGKNKQRPKRTTTTDESGKRDILPIPEFIDFVEYIDRRASEQGCVLPDPDPMHRRER